MANKQPIIITGSHRSGTTFIGEMLSIPKSVGYLYEPFNKDSGLAEMEQIPYWLPYTAENAPTEEAMNQIMDKLIAGQANYATHVNPKSKMGNIRQLIGFRRRNFQSIYQSAIKDPGVKALIIKDPLLCLSVGYFHRQRQIPSLIIIRHPAAVVASINRLGWEYDFEDMFSQEQLMDEHLSVVFRKHNPSKLSKIERIAVLWLCINKVLKHDINTSSNILWTTHEDVSREPIDNFRSFYQAFGLKFNSDVEKKIKSYTSARNPADPKNNKVHALKRDSRENIKRWKKVLSNKEIGQIRKITGQLASTWYSDSDW